MAKKYFKTLVVKLIDSEVIHRNTTGMRKKHKSLLFMVDSKQITLKALG